MDDLADRFAGRAVRSAFIYTREAHPGENYRHHESMEDKRRNARAYLGHSSVRRQILLDDLEGTAHRAYGILPNMTWIVGRGGMIHYKSAWTSAADIDHKFPMPHKDVMEQVVDYKVPREKLSDLARYDGSVYVDVIRGEISARCDMAAANFVALNLADDIVKGKRGVEDARKYYPQAVMAHMEKKPSPYAEKLQFAAKGDTAFPDETIVSKDMVQKAEKIKEAMMKDKEKAGAAAGGTKK